jgi:2,3-dihydroxybiphenyl 1,2-dioxygenase
MSVTCLGYFGLGVSDPLAWGKFATEVLGLMRSAADGNGLRFRNDDQVWRIEVNSAKAGEPDDVSFLGFEVASRDELAALRARLREAGVVTMDAEPSVINTRGVTDMFSCRDPDGLLVEIYWGRMVRGELPFVSPNGFSFITGDQGVGHVVLSTANIDAMRTFYRDLLGFRLSDIIGLARGENHVVEVEFYHCNPRHHSLALVPVPMPNRLHHFMLEVSTLDAVGFARDYVERAQAPIVLDIGRHTNDQVISFYARMPGGLIFEVGYGGIQIDDRTWRVMRHTAAHTWGHRGTTTIPSTKP